MKSEKWPRAIRNNNPFNIKKSDQPWRGKITEIFPEHRDKVFEQFTSMEFGVRAGLKLIYNYIYLYGLSTIYEVIERFAPRSENATDAYCKYVQNYISMHHSVYTSKTQHSLVGSRENFFLLCSAIIAYETGLSFTGRENLGLTVKGLEKTFDKYFQYYNFKNY